MSKVAIVYWSGTGNTEAMANAVLSGTNGNGELFTASSFDASKVNDYDTFAFGCPSMGAEQLEESEFEPMFLSVEGFLSGKKVGLFGSWGWGGGAWMDDWSNRCANDGMQVINTVTCNGAPDDAALKECEELGKSLAE